MNFYDRMKSLASERGLSLNKIERDLGYPRNSLSNYKQGKEPSARRLTEISRYFAVSKDYLLGEASQSKLSDNADELGGLLEGLTDSRKNEVIRLLHEKITEQENETNLVYNHLGTVEAIEVKSLNGIDAFKQGRPNVKVALPFDEIPNQYDVALLLSDLNFPFLVRNFVESIVRSGDILFITFPKGVYDPSITTFELLGLIYIESTDKNGETIYVREIDNDFQGRKNTAIVLKLYHTPTRKS